MTSKRDANRQKLRESLIKAATARIETGGLANLRARELATDAGCALGALYTAFADLDDLILHVNSHTLHQLDTNLTSVESASADMKPGAQMVRLAECYLDFAVAHPNRWAALFEHRMPDGVTVPDWHLAEHAILFHHIIKPLAAMRPDMSAEQLPVVARGLFSAVHGVVSLGLQQRFSAVPRDSIRSMLSALILPFAESFGSVEFSHV